MSVAAGQFCITVAVLRGDSDINSAQGVRTRSKTKLGLGRKRDSVLSSRSTKGVKPLLKHVERGELPPFRSSILVELRIKMYRD